MSSSAQSDQSTPVPIYLLSGKKGVGKSTVAVLIQTLIPGTVELALATPLKNVCRTMFNLTDDQLYDEKSKEIIDERWGISGRVIMQRIGDLFRNYLSVACPDLKLDHTIFIQNLLTRIEQVKKEQNPPAIIVSDMRMMDEKTILQQLPGAVSIKIIREIAGSSDSHISEAVPFDCDHTIHNNGSLSELVVQVANICKRVN